MGLKLNRNGKIIVTSVALLMISSAFLFQNCSPAPLDTEDTASTGLDPGNSLFRLPATSTTDTYSTGMNCSVTANTTTVAIGGAVTYTFTTSRPIPAGHQIYAYGSRQNIADASAVAPEFYSALTPITTPGSTTTTYVQSVTNDGTLGGNYVRYFQVRDNMGRALCQTNSVAFTFDGAICTLSIPFTTYRSGNAVIFTTRYIAPSTTAPTGAVLQFLGKNNGLDIAAIPYDSTNLTTYSRTMNGADIGSEYIRRIAVNNSDGTPYCVTNSVRFRVTQ